VQRLDVGTGATIAYLDTGPPRNAPPDVPTLVFLHGLATYGLSWWPNIAALRARYRCIALDLPGHGLSSRGDHAYSMRFFAHSVLHLLGALRLQSVCLVGHSMGGQIALTAVAEEPRCAERLVLCAPAGFETFGFFERTAYSASMHAFGLFSDDESSLRSGIRSSFSRHFPPAAARMTDDLLHLLRPHSRSQYRRIIDRCISGMLDAPVWDRLPAVQQPTLVVFGEEDRLIPANPFSQQRPADVARAGTDRMPRAALRLVPRAGHFVHWEAAALVNDWITEWVES